MLRNNNKYVNFNQRLSCKTKITILFFKEKQIEYLFQFEI